MQLWDHWINWPYNKNDRFTAAPWWVLAWRLPWYLLGRTFLALFLVCILLGWGFETYDSERRNIW